MVDSNIVHRRDYLVATGTVTATITGGAGRIPDEVAAQENQSEQDGEQSDPIAQAGQFNLVALEAPDEVEVMTPFTYSYTVANRGDEDATFWTYLILNA